MIDSLPSALTKPTEEDKVINCSVCLKKKSKLTNKADMYCYNCKDVFCDQHAGVSRISIDSFQNLTQKDKMNSFKFFLSDSELGNLPLTKKNVVSNNKVVVQSNANVSYKLHTYCLYYLQYCMTKCDFNLLFLHPLTNNWKLSFLLTPEDNS